MPQMKFAAFLPHFSGFSSADWAALVSDPQHRAAQKYAKEKAAEGGPDAEDFLEIIEQMQVSAKQHSLLACAFTQSFAIHLGHSMESPNGIQFERYDFDADRIVITVPLSTIRRLIMQLKLVTLAPLLNSAALLGDDCAKPAADVLDPVVAECLNRLDPTFLCSMFGATVKRSIEKRELTKLAGEADRVFNQSVDWSEFHSMVWRRRNEERGIARNAIRGTVH
jgi:hypothetical protein